MSAHKLKGEFLLHKMLGINPELTRKEFLVVANQRDDLSNKLKALKPLLKDIGLDLDITEKQNNVQINVQMSSPKDPALAKAEYEIVPPVEIATISTI
ncbi:MAG: hypothetical protein AAB875_00510 [Patescibacteria group bacterium]